MATTNFGNNPKKDSKPNTTVNFLPFITKSSTSSSIFHALVSRAKGVSTQTITTIFSAILILGPVTVKETAKNFKGRPTTKSVFDALRETYKTYTIPSYTLKYLEHILMFYGTGNLKNSSGFTREELVMYFCCLFVAKPEELKNLGFDLNLTHIKKFSFEKHNPELDFKNYNFFDKSHIHIGFASFEEFRAYYAYSISKTPIKLFCPVFIENKQSESYSKKDSISPYSTEHSASTPKKSYKIFSTQKDPNTDWSPLDDDIPF